MSKKRDNVIEFPREPAAKVDADAARWLARATSGTMTISQLAEFEYWRVASPDHDRTYRELEAMWDGLSERDLFQRSTTHVPAALGPVHSWAWATRLAQAAAAGIALVLTSQYASAWRYDYHTAPSEIRDVVLADGSRVSLKGNTAMSVHVSRTGARLVDLARGEAFFDVKHDSRRPFTVRAGRGEVRDIGTAFSVARHGDAVSVAVARGIVSVAAAGQSDVIYRGQEIAFGPYEMGSKSLVDIATISAWRRNLYVADGRTLGEVLNDLNEYHSSKIVILNSRLAARRVNVVVHLDHIDDWLNALDDTKGVAVRRYGPITLVSAR